MCESEKKGVRGIVTVTASHILVLVAESKLCAV